MFLWCSRVNSSVFRTWLHNRNRLRYGQKKIEKILLIIKWSVFSALWLNSERALQEELQKEHFETGILTWPQSISISDSWTRSPATLLDSHSFQSQKWCRVKQRPRLYPICRLQSQNLWGVVHHRSASHCAWHGLLKLNLRLYFIQMIRVTPDDGQIVPTVLSASLMFIVVVLLVEQQFAITMNTYEGRVQWSTLTRSLWVVRDGLGYFIIFVTTASNVPHQWFSSRSQARSSHHLKHPISMLNSTT